MNAKVMIVDDSSLSRRTLRRIVEAAGYGVVEATDGLSAIEQYFLEKPDVVLLDLVMSGMYGLDVLSKLREMDPAARVIIATADVQSSTQQLAAAGGGCGFVSKPFTPEQVLDAIQAGLDKGTKGDVGNATD